jgi:uncharacterized protein YfcZ (UPF0381/DUF406 family)
VVTSSAAFSPDDEAQDALDALEAWARHTWADGCSWKSKATAWSRCLDDARAVALRDEARESQTSS